MTALCLFLLAMLGAGSASAARLAFVLGTIEQPEGVNEGDELAPGTVVQSGDDALVMVEHRWRSDIPSRDCIQIAIFGYGERYTVSESETPGRCQTTVPSNLAALDAGQPFLARETRYGDAKFDEPKVPGQVAASQARWQGFDRWLRDARRSFNGVVMSVGGNRIRVRSPSSGNQQEFRIDPARIDSPVALDTLLNKSVRVDYRGTGYKPLAVRIRLTSPPTKPSVAKPTPLPPMVIDRPQPAEPRKPDEIRRTPREPGRKANRSVERWRCNIDLHQGDTGTLQFERADGNVRGTITVRNGSQQHRISGTWKEDRIEFWRALSERSGQPFAGTVADAGDGVMRIAGRFANEYRGVWSADCRLEGEAGASAGSAGQLDIVLIDPGENKMAVIKAVRAITGLGLREAKAAVESAPYTIQSGVSEKDAEGIAAELERAGARVAIQPKR